MMNDKRDHRILPDESGSAHESTAVDGDNAALDDEPEQITVNAAAWQTLQQQLQTQQEQVLRIKAEADNQLKREQRQLERYRQLALEAIMRQLLEVRDSIEMGLQASASASSQSDQPAGEAPGTQQQLDALSNGMQMTLKLLDKTMADNHAEIIDPQGEPFDPEWHEAMSVQENTGDPKDTVVKVMQKGCRLRDRLLRPAMVIVSAG